MEKFSVSRLIGAPPGYVGYEDSGTLTKAVRRKPYSVILLDEIEKAHPDVFNILLQVLDEGHLTDNYGRVIDFKNTVVIMTSNVGARDLTKTQVARLHERRREANWERRAEKVRDELKNVFNPEFLNRLDDVIVFHPLTREHISQIVSVLLKDVRKRLAEEELTLKLTRRGHRIPRQARLRRAVRRAAAQAGDSEVHRGSALGEDPHGRLLAGGRDRGRRRRPTGRSSTSAFRRALLRRRPRSYPGKPRRPVGPTWDPTGRFCVYCRTMRQMRFPLALLGVLLAGSAAGAQDSQSPGLCHAGQRRVPRPDARFPRGICGRTSGLRPRRRSARGR